MQMHLPLVIASEAVSTVAVQTVIAIVGAFLIGTFVYWFVIPAIRGDRVLTTVIEELSARRGAGRDIDGEPIHPDEIRSLFESEQSEKLLQHPWIEFRHTLYPVEVKPGEGEFDDIDDDLVDVTDGSPGPKQFRQTVPARDHFSYGNLVETPLHTEFFKHLPGILTGLGIIGTFSGVIIGLSGFDPTQETPDVDPLLQAIAGAFWMSALAIFAAILITAIEKFLVSRRLAKVATLCEVIDSLFPARTSDFYLRRISHHVGSQGSQLKQLKVLTEALQEVQQAIREGNEVTRIAISEALAEDFKEFMKRFLDEVAEGLSVHVQELRQATETLNETTRDLRSMAESAHAAGAALSENIHRTAEATSGIKDATEVSRQSVENAAQAAERIGEASTQLLESIDSAGQALAGVRGEIEGSRDVASGLATAADQLRRFTGSLADELVKAQDAFAQATAVTLQTQHGQFDEQLRATVTTMAIAIREAGEQFETMSAIVEEMRLKLETLESQDGRSLEDDEDQK